LIVCCSALPALPDSFLCRYEEFAPWWEKNGGKALKKQAAAGEILMNDCTRVSTMPIDREESGPRYRIVVDTPKRAVTLLPPAGKEEWWFQLLM
jgi:hypothetical protein